MSNIEDRKIRRHDIDWLRVIVFGILILFHIAVGFVPWGIYGYQNNHVTGEIGEVIIIFIHYWRLPALFLISGMGTCYAFRHRNGGSGFRGSVEEKNYNNMVLYVKERFKRLLIPLIAGTLIVNSFISYYRTLNDSVEKGFNTFSPLEIGNIDKVLADIFLRWENLFGFNHLWFLISLLIYSLICAPLFLYIKNNSDGKLVNGVKKIFKLPMGIGLLFIVPIPIIMVELLVKPVSPGFIGGGYEFPWYLCFFIIGYLCITVNDAYWKSLDKIRYISLIAGIICSILLIILIGIAENISPGYGDLLGNGGWVLYGDKFWGELTFPASILHALNAWFWCLVLVSWGAKYLNKPSKRLKYLNQAVYPFYIFHMTFTLVSLYYIKDLEIYWPLKFIFMIVIVTAGCWITFEITRRNRVTRFLFGIKQISKGKKH